MEQLIVFRKLSTSVSKTGPDVKESDSFAAGLLPLVLQPEGEGAAGMTSIWDDGGQWEKVPKP